MSMSMSHEPGLSPRRLGLEVYLFASLQWLPYSLLVSQARSWWSTGSADETLRLMSAHTLAGPDQCCEIRSSRRGVKGIKVETVLRAPRCRYSGGCWHSVGYRHSIVLVFLGSSGV